MRSDWRNMLHVNVATDNKNLNSNKKLEKLPKIWQFLTYSIPLKPKPLCGDWPPSISFHSNPQSNTSSFSLYSVKGCLNMKRCNHDTVEKRRRKSLNSDLLLIWKEVASQSSPERTGMTSQSHQRRDFLSPCQHHIGRPAMLRHCTSQGSNTWVTSAKQEVR